MKVQIQKCLGLTNSQQWVTEILNFHFVLFFFPLKGGHFWYFNEKNG